MQIDKTHHCIKIKVLQRVMISHCQMQQHRNNVEKVTPNNSITKNQCIKCQLRCYCTVASQTCMNVKAIIQIWTKLTTVLWY